ncbi:MAG: cytochrome C oxidase subunit IV family protein [Flavobacteriales bacterium]|nr:cytochrome C oxidase subunit IV family protein [Flavobacteriales bacterium]MCB0986311.1 cytochrome C oxidase subunit IV family protein [Acidimicrobiales bacterium]
MSADANTVTVPAAAHGGGHAHPTDKLFVKTAIILAVVTAIEVAWSYLPWDDWGDGKALYLFEVGGLLAMMAFKFFVVASVFMHLKFDSKLLTRAFYAGLFLALAVYLGVLATFEFFTGGGSTLPN